MQFNNDITRKVAEEAARIMAEAQKGSHPKTEKEKDLAALGHPKDKITHKDVLIGRGVLKNEEKELDEALVGNQHRIDANKNNKIDAHDFKLLRAKKKMKEETELTESHFKVGDEVVCKASGMEGEVVKVDPKGEGKYYTVKREDGKMMKYAPDELKKDDEDEDEKEDKKVNEASAKQENKFHKKLDNLVHGTFGKSSDEKMKKEEVELDEALWPGTPEYEKKFPKESKPGERRKTQDYGYQGKEEEHGETTFRKEVKPAKRGKYGARQNYIRSRKVSGKTLKDDVEVGFVDILEAYDTHGLKFIAAMMREEPDNEEFTKEYEDQKKSMEGKKKQPNIAKASVQAVKQEEVEQVEEGLLGKVAAGVGSFIGNKIDPTHGEIMRTHAPEVLRQARYHATNAVNKIKKKINREEVEQVEERTLTEPETAKKEEIVKSMKKGVKGFKQRYGENAKSVMYATATKIAKEKA